MEQILNRWDAYFTRFDKLFDVLVKIQETQNGIISKLNTLEERNYQCNCFDINGSAIYSALVKFRADTGTIYEKACRIAWVGIDEKPDDSATSAFDKEAVKEIIDSSGDSDLLEEWQSRRVEVHRHPKSSSSPRIRPRIRLRSH